MESFFEIYSYFFNFLLFLTSVDIQQAESTKIILGVFFVDGEIGGVFSEFFSGFFWYGRRPDPKWDPIWIVGSLAIFSSAYMITDIVLYIFGDDGQNKNQDKDPHQEDKKDKEGDNDDSGNDDSDSDDQNKNQNQDPHQEDKKDKEDNKTL